MANVNTSLGRGNVALSVTLTAVSCLATMLATPVALAVVQPGLGDSIAFSVPLPVLAGQLVLLLVLVGMGIRRRWPDAAVRHRGALLGVSVVSLVGLLALVIIEDAEQFARALADLAAAAGVLTVVTFAAGWATGYNPYTGREVTEKQAYNPSMGREAEMRTATNAYTGRTT
jgi:BASS family bile acid:Na+ symporter